MSEPITRRATLTRISTGPDGTFGEWLSDSGFTCKTVEKPWAENQTDISCIQPAPEQPAMTYVAQWLWSPKHKCNVYHLQDPTRVAVEIHSANLQLQLQGCIAPGASFGMFQANAISDGMPPQPAQGVVSSVETLAKLEKDLQDDEGNQVPFILTIQWSTNTQLSS